MKKSKSKSKKTTLEIMQTVRNTWGNVNPVTRVHSDGPGYNRNKEKKKWKKDDDYHRVTKIV
ncbi:MAG: hypothetical protein N2483_11090 [Burkholderiaceae bacterium]|nr:hypothetical protein [Burkholderiaceae bacterium]